MNYKLALWHEITTLLTIDQEKIQLKKGEELTITLDSIPTGGYDWLLSFNHDVICIISRKVERKSENALGGSTKTVFKFKTINFGTTNLKMSYKRNWESNVVAEKSYLIEVKWSHWVKLSWMEYYWFWISISVYVRKLCLQILIFPYNAFITPEKKVSWAGLCPSVHQSGYIYIYMGRIKDQNKKLT